MQSVTIHDANFPAMTSPAQFAGPLRSDFTARIERCLQHGDHTGAATLLDEATTEFPGDEAFIPLQKQLRRQMRRAEQCEFALADAATDLAADSFVSALGKLRQALTLSRGIGSLEHRVFEAAVSGASRMLPDNWRVAESLLGEAATIGSRFPVPESLVSEARIERREETIANTLTEAIRAENEREMFSARARLSRLIAQEPYEARLGSRLQALDLALVAQLGMEGRAQIMRRCIVIRDRTDSATTREMWDHFAEYCKELAGPFIADPEYLAIVYEITAVSEKYDAALQELDNHDADSALAKCEEILLERPSNLLFLALRDSARTRLSVEGEAAGAMRRIRALGGQERYTEALEELRSVEQMDPTYPELASFITLYEDLSRRGSHTACVSTLGRGGVAGFILPDPGNEGIMIGPEKTWRPRIAMSPEGWRMVKTGLAATAALLVLALLLFSRA